MGEKLLLRLVTSRVIDAGFPAGNVGIRLNNNGTGHLRRKVTPAGFPFAFT